MARTVDVAVISDVHLGTPACRAAELLAYLRSINPAVLILNGDILDLHALRRRRWPRFPDAHAAVVSHLLALAAAGARVQYVVGNHDAALRRWIGLRLAHVELVDRLDLRLAGRRTLIVHGDSFERRGNALGHLLGSAGYSALLAASNMCDRLGRIAGAGPFGLVGAVKRRIPGVAAYVARFAQACAAGAAAAGYDQVLCGHIHEAALMPASPGRAAYLNSGDWIESCTALELSAATWSLMRWRGGRAETEALPSEAAHAATAPLCAA